MKRSEPERALRAYYDDVRRATVPARLGEPAPLARPWAWVAVPAAVGALLALLVGAAALLPVAPPTPEESQRAFLRQLAAVGIAPEDVAEPAQSAPRLRSEVTTWRV